MEELSSGFFVTEVTYLSNAGKRSRLIPDMNDWLLSVAVSLFVTSCIWLGLASDSSAQTSSSRTLQATITSLDLIVSDRDGVNFL